MGAVQVEWKRKRGMRVSVRLANGSMFQVDVPGNGRLTLPDEVYAKLSSAFKDEIKKVEVKKPASTPAAAEKKAADAEKAAEEKKAADEKKAERAPAGRRRGGAR